jgi:hypothetical protein
VAYLDLVQSSDKHLHTRFAAPLDKACGIQLPTATCHSGVGYASAGPYAVLLAGVFEASDENSMRDAFEQLGEVGVETVVGVAQLSASMLLCSFLVVCFVALLMIDRVESEDLVSFHAIEWDAFHGICRL